MGKRDGREWARKRERERKIEWVKCAAPEHGGWEHWRITGEKNPRLIWHLMDYCPGKPEDFFPSSFFPPDRFPRENGPGKWRLQVETFVRKDRTLHRPSCLLASVHRVTSIWVLLMWEMATQEFKFRNYFRTFGVAAHVKPTDEKGLSVDKRKKKKGKKYPRSINSFTGIIELQRFSPLRIYIYYKKSKKKSHIFSFVQIEFCILWFKFTVMYLYSFYLGIKQCSLE